MRNNPYKSELKAARSQRNRLKTISARLKEMSCEWDGVSGWMETESERLADSVDEHLKALEEQIQDWEQGPDSQRDD
jgi:SOS-response transcriptional repressor LexA